MLFTRQCFSMPFLLTAAVEVLYRHNCLSAEKQDTCTRTVSFETRSMYVCSFTVNVEPFTPVI